MSQRDVDYSCGSCGYPLNLSSSNRSTSEVGSSYKKSLKKGLISFVSVDLSRFTQVDEISCFPLTWRAYRPKTKLLCRKCGASIGYGYGEPAVLCSFDPASSSSSSTSQKYLIKIQALQPSDGTQNWLKVRNIGRKSLTFHCSFNPTIDKVHAKCIPNILACSPCLNRISLAGLSELPDSALNSLRMSGSSLQSLSLYYCSGMTDDDLALVAIGCPNLVVVELQSCFNITDAGLKSLSKGCHALKSLNLGSCMGISDRGVSAIFSNCSNICTLIITGCRRVSGVGFRGCPITLRYLEAESCMLSPDGLSDVVSGGGLEYLNLHKLGSSTGLDGLGGLAFAKSLRILNLRMCRYLTDDSVSAIASGCPFLEEWNLAICHGVHLPGWSAIRLYCNKLRVLHVNRCRNICDQSLIALGEGCPHLEVLHINGCVKITNNGLAFFNISRPQVNLRVDEVMSIGPSIENLFRVQ